MVGSGRLDLLEGSCAELLVERLTGPLTTKEAVADT
jgi:hypothetical protein